ncbi:unnamed protein product [Cylindrotheca closterium]|uniref:Uncharacterized protein n=1 Tax=Cylindrotheca closterium TaxID=2856 RepID=A0AAD2CJJ5_9STRA|nr:unnamed protein product [Cylindrotheca closterium]
MDKKAIDQHFITPRTPSYGTFLSWQATLLNHKARGASTEMFHYGVYAVKETSRGNRATNKGSLLHQVFHNILCQPQNQVLRRTPALPGLSQLMRLTLKTPVNHYSNPLQAGDSVSNITSPTDIMPGFEPDGGSEEDTAAMEEEKNKTEKKKGSFGMLWEATVLADFQEFVSKTLFAHYSAPESKLSNQQINSQTCPSKLPPQVSQEGLRNYIHSRLNNNLDPSFQTEDNGESVNFEYDDDHEEEESAELSIESEARNNPNGSFVTDLDVGSQYGANYFPNDITLPTINFEVDDPHAPQPPLHNIPNPDSSNYLLDRLKQEEYNGEFMPPSISTKMEADLHLLCLTDGQPPMFLTFKHGPTKRPRKSLIFFCRTRPLGLNCLLSFDFSDG